MHKTDAECCIIFCISSTGSIKLLNAFDPLMESGVSHVSRSSTEEGLLEQCRIDQVQEVEASCSGSRNERTSYSPWACVF